MRAAARLALLLAAACGSVGDSDVSARLVPGLSEEEALAVLAQGAKLSVVQVRELPAGGDWTERIRDPRLLGAALSAGARSPRPIASVIQVHRSTWTSTDTFFLFFDPDRRLAYHERIREG